MEGENFFPRGTAKFCRQPSRPQGGAVGRGGGGGRDAALLGPERYRKWGRKWRPVLGVINPAAVSLVLWVSLCRRRLGTACCPAAEERLKGGSGGADG